MLRTIPKDKYKSVKIGKQVDVTGFKSETYEYPDGFDNPVLNNDRVSLTINTNHDKASQFKFHISGREDLLKLKEAVDFALEVDEKKE